MKTPIFALSHWDIYAFRWNVMFLPTRRKKMPEAMPPLMKGIDRNRMLFLFCQIDKKDELNEFSMKYFCDRFNQRCRAWSNTFWSSLPAITMQKKLKFNSAKEHRYVKLNNTEKRFVHNLSVRGKLSHFLTQIILWFPFFTFFSFQFILFHMQVFHFEF